MGELLYLLILLVIRWEWIQKFFKLFGKDLTDIPENLWFKDDKKKPLPINSKPSRDSDNTRC